MSSGTPLGGWLRQSRPFAVALVAAVQVSCATHSVGTEPAADLGIDPEERLTWALTLLHDQDYVGARDELAWLYLRHGNRPVGHRALLAAAAVELDPRNPQQDPDAGALLAAHYLQQPDTPPPSDPVAQTIYLLALELGARSPVRVTDLLGDATAAVTLRPISRPLLHLVPDPASETRQTQVQTYLTSRARQAPPELPAESAAARIRALEQQISALSEQLRQAEDTLDARDRELERIRRTLGSP